MTPMIIGMAMLGLTGTPTHSTLDQFWMPAQFEECGPRCQERRHEEAEEHFRIERERREAEHRQWEHERWEREHAPRNGS